MKKLIPGQTALLALILLFVSVSGCRQFIDLPLTTEASKVPDVTLHEELQATQAPTPQHLPEPAPQAQPVLGKNVRVVERQRDSGQVRSMSAGRPEMPTADDHEIETQPLSVKQDASGPTGSDSKRAEKLTSDGDSPLLVVTEIVLFLVVGTVFVLVHVSRKRSRPFPDKRLGQLLHNRPWR